MAKKQKQEEAKKGAPAWMATFSDLMTLLLCFFVLLFGMSSLDTSKFQAFINSFQGSMGILDGADVLMNTAGMLGSGIDSQPEEITISDIEIENIEQYEAIQEEMENVKDALEEFLESQGLENKVTVEQDGEEVVLTFEDFMLFDSGQALIKQDALDVLSTIGAELNKYLGEGYVGRAEGHTDNIPINSTIFPSNWELSASRAIAVAKYLINNADIAPASLSAEGFGEFYPIATNDTPEGRAANRRVEIKIIKDAIE